MLEIFKNIIDSAHSKQWLKLQPALNTSKSISDAISRHTITFAKITPLQYFRIFARFMPLDFAILCTRINKEYLIMVTSKEFN